MKKLIIIIITLLFSISCSSTCMEYRSATTAARSEKNLKRAEEWALKALESSECNPENDALAPYFLATEVYLKQKKFIYLCIIINSIILQEIFNLKMKKKKLK